MIPNEREDYKTVARILKGDEQALDAFVDEYYPRLYRFAFPRLSKNTEATQDVVQGTFEKVIPQLSAYRGEAGGFFLDVLLLSLRNCRLLAGSSQEEGRKWN